MWYKVLTRDLYSAHGGDFDWFDYVGRPNKRAPHIRDVAICDRGYHATTDPMRWPVVGMRVFEAVVPGEPVETRDDKGVWPTMGIGAEHPELVPDWWHDVEAFVAELPRLPWLEPQGKPDPSWYVFDTYEMAQDAVSGKRRDIAWGKALDAAREAARVAMRGAARNAAWKAAWGLLRGVVFLVSQQIARGAGLDAALWTSILVCKGLPLAQEHIDHARARMDVWRRGYGVLCDASDVYGVEGTLYVYRKR